MINLQAHGYKIIDSNILQSMSNEVGRCTSCRKQNLQIRENANNRIGMCENLVLFCLSCKKDIYSFNTSPRVEEEKKKGMMDINLRSVAAVTYLGHHLLKKTFVCILTFPRPLLNIIWAYMGLWCSG